MAKNHDADVSRIRKFTLSLSDFRIQSREGASYAHMGATICDTILQSGLNYRTVVAPRVNNLMRRWPLAQTTSKFLTMILRNGLNDVLNWQHTEKPIRIGQLTEFLKAHQIETEQELSVWLTEETTVDALMQLNGIGPKTIDYLKSLVGLQAVAVDRHVKTFVKWAGVNAKSYDEIKELVSKTADSMEVGRNAFDHAIWSYVSNSLKRAA